MNTKYNIGDTVLIPMTVTKISVSKNSGIIYRVESNAFMDSNMKDVNYTIYANEESIDGKSCDTPDNEESNDDNIILDSFNKKSRL